MLARALRGACSQIARQGGAYAQLAGSAVEGSAVSSSSSAVGQAACWGRRAYATNSHDIFNTHRHTKINNWETEFDFTPENYKKVEQLVAKFPTNWKQSACIPLLDLAQTQNDGWLSLAAMNRVAKVLEMPEIRVYEVATFYTMFNRSKMGRYHVMVCGTTPCMLQGAQGIYEAVRSHLGVGYGETTEDGLFTVSEMECMGACVNAPMIAVADYSNGVQGFTYDYYEDLTPADTVAILDTLRSGGKPTVGSQHRRDAEAAGAVVGDRWVPRPASTPTLQGTPRGPYCRNLDEPPPPPPEEAKK